MQIANRGTVDAVFHKSFVVPNDTADVRCDTGIVCCEAAQEIQDAAGVDCVQAESWIHALGVHIASVLAGKQRSLVHTRNTAGVSEAADRPGTPAGGDDSRRFVFPYNSPDLVDCGHLTAEAAVGERTRVAPDESSDHTVIPKRKHASARVQIVDHRVLAGLQKQPAGGLCVVDSKVIDGISVSVEVPVKIRDRIKGCAGQGNIAVQDHLHTV